MTTKAIVELEDVSAAAGEVCCPPILDATLSVEDAERAAALFRALADPARVQLLSLIARAPQREACVCDLVDAVDRSQPTISHHLRVLLDAGLVERERRGSWAYYRLREPAITALAAALGGSVAATGERRGR